MFWTIVDRCASLSLLLLAFTMILVLTNASSEGLKTDNILAKLDLYRQEQVKVMSNNVQYFETKINRVAEQQDSYQNSSDQRLSILEAQVKLIQADRKLGQKNINVNNNNSNAIVYEK